MKEKLFDTQLLLRRESAFSCCSLPFGVHVELFVVCCGYIAGYELA